MAVLSISQFPGMILPAAPKAHEMTAGSEAGCCTKHAEFTRELVNSGVAGVAGIPQFPGDIPPATAQARNSPTLELAAAPDSGIHQRTGEFLRFWRCGNVPVPWEHSTSVQVGSTQDIAGCCTRVTELTSTLVNSATSGVAGMLQFPGAFHQRQDGAAPRRPGHGSS